MTAELKAGFFVLVALGALVFMTTKVTQNRYSFAGVKRYYAIVNDATGLLSKTKVKMAGLDVGHLSDIQLAGKRAKISLEVAADIVLHKDASISIKSIGFLGDKYIELFPGLESSPALAEGATLTESIAGGGLDQLTAKTTEVLENIREITDVLKGALKGADGVDGSDTRLDRILDNMEEFSEGLAGLDKIGEMSERLNHVAANLEDITTKVKNGEGTVGKLLNDTETIDRINTTLSGVNKFLTKADKLAINFDMRAAALTRTGGARTYFSIAFQPTWDKYYLIGASTGPRTNMTSTLTTTTVGPDGGGSVTTTQRVEERKENAIMINAQFAKRFYDAVFRLGLFETTGGLAADYYLFKDRFKVYSEIYRFGGDYKPQFNAGAEVHFLRPFYVWTGGDDILNKPFRNYFVGVGLRFSDQDLKTLISAAIAAPRF